MRFETLGSFKSICKAIIREVVGFSPNSEKTIRLYRAEMILSGYKAIGIFKITYVKKKSQLDR